MHQQDNYSPKDNTIKFEGGGTAQNTYLYKCLNIIETLIFEIDANYNLLFANQKACATLGYEQEKITSIGFLKDLTCPNCTDGIHIYLNGLLKSKEDQPQKRQICLLTSDNSRIYIDAGILPLKDEGHNRVQGFLITGTLIKQYQKHNRELQHDINLYRILTRNIPDINLFIIDSNFRFILAEGSGLNTFDTGKTGFEGKTVDQITDIEILNIWKPLFKSALKGHEISTEYIYNNQYYLMRAIPLSEKEKDKFNCMAIIQNISEEKFSEERLKKSRDEAEKANKAKSDFLAHVSHEIRTPLNAILGFTEQLLHSNINNTQKEYLKIIDKSSEHLLSLINDILILSKIEARKLTFDKSPFNIVYTVEYIRKSFLSDARDKGLQFNIHVDNKLDRILIGDSFRLQQILINLVSNAMKFTNNGYIDIRCFAMHETKNEIKVRFDVVDTGIGINQNKLEDIFKQFKQADSTVTKHYGGTGLGLTICKNLIELQNGSLQVSSQEGLGSTFSFVLPFTKGTQKDLKLVDYGKVDKSTLINKKMLLVDDDSVNRLLAKTIIEKFGSQYDIANNGKEAIEILKKQQYDIILLDIHMPDISGIEVAKYLRNALQDNATKIIAVTAAVIKSDIDEYYNAGIDDFLIKPYKEVHLFNKICYLLNMTSAKMKQRKTETIIQQANKENHKAFDLTDLKTMAGNNQDFIKNMLQTIVQNSNDTLAKFETYQKAKNWKQIGEAAHKLLPAYRHIKAEKEVELLTLLKEKTLVKPDFEDLPTILDKTKHAIKQLVNALDLDLR